MKMEKRPNFVPSILCSEDSLILLTGINTNAEEPRSRSRPKPRPQDTPNKPRSNWPVRTEVAGTHAKASGSMDKTNTAILILCLELSVAGSRAAETQYRSGSETGASR